MWPTVIDSLMIGGPVSAGMWALLWAADRFGRARVKPKPSTGGERPVASIGVINADYGFSAKPRGIVGALAKEVPIQCCGYDGTPAMFGAADILAAEAYGDSDVSPLFRPTVTWYTPSGRQTGYDQGQILVRLTQDQMDIARAASPCRVWVSRALTGDLSRTEMIARFDIPCGA